MALVWGCGSDSNDAKPLVLTPPVATTGTSSSTSSSGGGGNEDGSTPNDAGDASTSTGRTFYATDDSLQLVSFRLSNPGTLTLARTNITGLTTGEDIRGLDIRPVNNLLYALGSKNHVYTIDTTTGAATTVGAAPFTPTLAAERFSFDFNPSVDRIRVIGTTTATNLRLNPTDGTTAATDTSLSYAIGTDAGDASTPRLVDVAYTNNYAAATATTLYGIDQNRGMLVRFQGSPNAGVVEDVGLLGIQITQFAGFDILGGTADGGTTAALEAYAALQKVGDNFSGLYTINLTTGAATLVGRIGASGTAGIMTSLAAK